MQYTIRELYSMERKGTLRSVRNKRIVKPSDPLTIVNEVFLPNEIYTIRELYSTERKGTLRSVRIERIVKPSDPLTIINDVFEVSLMRCNIRSANCTLRSVRALFDPHGWNELNMLLTDRYNAGVLDNPQLSYM